MTGDISVSTKKGMKKGRLAMWIALTWLVPVIVAIALCGR